MYSFDDEVKNYVEISHYFGVTEEEHLYLAKKKIEIIIDELKKLDWKETHDFCWTSLHRSYEQRIKNIDFEGHVITFVYVINGKESKDYSKRFSEIRLERAHERFNVLLEELQKKKAAEDIVYRFRLAFDLDSYDYCVRGFSLRKEVVEILNEATEEELKKLVSYLESLVFKTPNLEYYDGPDYFKQQRIDEDYKIGYKRLISYIKEIMNKWQQEEVLV